MGEEWGIAAAWVALVVSIVTFGLERWSSRGNRERDARLAAIEEERRRRESESEEAPGLITVELVRHENRHLYWRLAYHGEGQVEEITLRTARFGDPELSINQKVQRLIIEDLSQAHRPTDVPAAMAPGQVAYLAARLDEDDPDETAVTAAITWKRRVSQALPDAWGRELMAVSDCTELPWH